MHAVSLAKIIHNAIGITRKNFQFRIFISPFQPSNFKLAVPIFNMLSVKTLFVLTIITIIISNPYYIGAAGKVHTSSESAESSQSHESHQDHHGSQLSTSHPPETTSHDVSRVMSVVTTKWRKYNNIKYDGKMHRVNTIISDMMENCTV